MKDEQDPLAADRRFFAALLDGDRAALDHALADDFVLIDVMTGGEITRGVMLDAVGSGQLRFEAIEPLESRVRTYGTVAVITGRTRMRGRFGAAPFAAHSRYTHVFVRQQGSWRLASAQGTPIVQEPPPA